jgi:hypothetical protein
MELDSQKILATAPRHLRLGPSRGLATQADKSVPPVDRAGGYRQAGIINSVSVITHGEALGHDQWVDPVMMEQVLSGINSEDFGVKSRYTHPGLSSDGLGKHVGRIMDARLSADGEQVLADQHFVPSSHRSPEGDLGGYLMDLAEDDPQAYGLSIVYEPDKAAEQAFFEAHGGVVTFDPDMGELWDNTNFVSPDPLNSKNLPHARVGSMVATDAVGEPAANEGGLFGREQNLITDADALAAYALGFTNTKPQLAQLSIDADRVRGFAQRYLTNHKLKVVPMADATTDVVVEVQVSDEGEIVTTVEPVAVTVAEVATDAPATEPAPEVVAAGSRAEVARYRKAFGEQGLAFWADGLSFEQAYAKQVGSLQKQVADLTAALAAAKQEAKFFAGVDGPIGTDIKDEKRPKGLANRINLK